jgi:hypothetical protein
MNTVKRPLRTRMRGVVGRAGAKPALTRLEIFCTEELSDELNILITLCIQMTRKLFILLFG